MTGDELDRAIDFLLKAGARCEARIEQVNQNLGDRIEETRQLLAEYARTQSNFIQVVTRRFEQQDEINRQHDETIQELKETNRRIAETIRMLAEADRTQAAAQSRTDERLDILVNTVERYISGRRDGQA